MRSTARDDAPAVIRFGRLGDMVLQTPLLRLLHARYGTPCLLVTSGSWSGALLAGHEDVGEIWQLRRRHVPLALSPQRWRLIARLRHGRGPVYVSEDSARQLPRIRRMLGIAGVAAERCLFLTDHAIGQTHWVDRLLHFGAMTPPAFRGRALGWCEEDVGTAPRLTPSAADRNDRDAWLLQRGLASQPLVLIQAGNKRALKWGRLRAMDDKAWPLEHWALLLRHVRTALPAAAIVLCGAPAERGMLTHLRLTAGVAGVHVAARDLPLRRLLALMEIAHSMVSVDTGPSHMAAATGCPLVVLYGTESASVWGRRSPTRSPVIELGGPPHHQAASQIEPQQVIDAWLRLAAAAPDGRARARA